MAFVKKRGKTKFMWLPIYPEGGAISAGSLLAWSTGKLIPATSSTTAANTVGVIRHAVATTDSDYDKDRLVEVEVPVESNVEWFADGASLSATTRGTYVDLTDAANVNGGASSIKVVQHIKHISATKGVFILNIGTSGMGTT